MSLLLQPWTVKAAAVAATLGALWLGYQWSQPPDFHFLGAKPVDVRGTTAQGAQVVYETYQASVTGYSGAAASRMYAYAEELFFSQLQEMADRDRRGTVEITFFLGQVVVDGKERIKTFKVIYVHDGNAWRRLEPMPTDEASKVKTIAIPEELRDAARHFHLPDSLPPGGPSKVETTTISPQASEGLGDAFLHPPLSVTRDPSPTIARPPDGGLVHAAREPPRVRTVIIRPQSPADLRALSRHSPLPATHDPGLTVDPNLDSSVVHTTREPSLTAPE